MNRFNPQERLLRADKRSAKENAHDHYQRNDRKPVSDVGP